MNLRPYVLSKWICPMHGHYSARTLGPVNPLFPIPCPECIRSLVYVSQCAGLTTAEVPAVTKPRIPKKTDIQATASDKAPLRKRGVGW